MDYRLLILLGEHSGKPIMVQFGVFGHSLVAVDQVIAQHLSDHGHFVGQVSRLEELSEHRIQQTLRFDPQIDAVSDVFLALLYERARWI